MAMRSGLLSSASGVALIVAAAALSPALAEDIVVSTDTNTAITTVVDPTGTITVNEGVKIVTTGGANHAINPTHGSLGAWTVNVNGIVEGTFTNSTTTTYGVFLKKGGAVNVGLNGSVAGSNSAIYGEGGPVIVQNDGYIAGNAGHISGNKAIHFDYGGVLENRGEVYGGVTFQTGSPSSKLVNSGEMHGDSGFGIIMNQGGVFENTGTIEYNDTTYGVITYDDVLFTNAGTIKSAQSVVATSYGVLLRDGDVTASNSGLIEGNQLGLFVFNGSADLTNSGTIRGALWDGVRLKPTGPISFKQTAGLVEGGQNGILVNTAGATTIEISGGSVKGGLVDAGSAGVSIDGVGATTMLVRNATIEGPAAAIRGGTGTGTFDLQILEGSIINGDVLLGNGNSTLTVAGGATIDGAINGQGGTNTITLIGSGDGAISGDIAGFSALTITGGNWTLGGDGIFAGGIDVQAGKLIANGALSGAVTLAGGTLLGGSGTITGNVDLQSTSTLAPGNSIGALHVTGDVTFGSGTVYQVEVKAGGAVAGTHNDVLDATGTVTIDPTTKVQVRAENGTDTGATFAPETKYTIVSAGSRLGEFDGTVDENLAFLDAALSYDSAHAYLTLSRNSVDFTDVARTPNEKAVSDAIAAFDPTDPIYRQLLGLSADQVNRAFDLASGEIHASGQVVIGQGMNLFLSAFSGMSGTGGPGSQLSFGPEPGMAVASELSIDPDGNDPHAVRQGAWIAPLAGRGKVDTDGNGASLDWWAAGLAGGYQTETVIAGGEANFGFGLGYSASGGESEDRLSSLDVDSGYVGVHGGWTDGTVSLSGGLAYGASAVATSRDIIVGAITHTATADYWAHGAALDLEASYGFDLAPNVTLSPIATIGLGWSGHEGATETGAGSLNASIDSASLWSLDAGAGLELAYTTPLASGGEVTIKGTALWEHSFGDTSPEQDVTLAGSPASFSISAPEAGRDRLKLGAGLSFEPSSNTSISLDYFGTISDQQVAHIGRAGLKIAF